MWLGFKLEIRQRGRVSKALFVVNNQRTVVDNVAAAAAAAAAVTAVTAVWLGAGSVLSALAWSWL